MRTYKSDQSLRIMCRSIDGYIGVRIVMRKIIILGALVPAIYQNA